MKCLWKYEHNGPRHWPFFPLPNCVDSPLSLDQISGTCSTYVHELALQELLIKTLIVDQFSYLDCCKSCLWSQNISSHEDLVLDSLGSKKFLLKEDLVLDHLISNHISSLAQSLTSGYDTAH